MTKIVKLSQQPFVVDENDPLHKALLELKEKLTPEQFTALNDAADPDCVSFADESLEQRWTQEALGFGDAR